MTGAENSRLWRSRLLAFLIPLALSAPFLNRAFFVDDSYFVEIASWLKIHPLAPYDFRTDDAGLGNPGWERGGLVRMVNPLGHHYLLAVLLKMGEGRIWFLRLGTVLLTSFSALFIFELARRFTAHPFTATVLAALSPPWWLTAHSLLIDSTMGAFFIAGLFFFIRAAETDSLRRAVMAGVLMGIAILCKYPAVLVLPVTAAWVALNHRKARRPWILVLSWVIALGFLCAYSGWTASLYGRPHIMAASARMVGSFGWPKALALAVFFSGSTLIPLTAWLVSGNVGRAIGFSVGAIVAGALSSTWGGFTGVQASLIGLWVSTSALFMGQVARLHKSWLIPRDLFLLVWCGGFLLMMIFVMDWVAVRYFHVVVPALAMVAVRFIEICWPGRERALFNGLMGVMFVTGLSLAYADYQQAEPGRQIGPILAEHGFPGGERHFYLGDSFTMSYLRNYGWTPCFEQTELRPGDIVLAKEVTMPLVWFARKNLPLRRLGTFEFGTRFPLKVMDMKGSAGFYASVWGALPFTFSDAPWERFRVYEVETKGDGA